MRNYRFSKRFSVAAFAVALALLQVPVAPAAAQATAPTMDDAIAAIAAYAPKAMAYQGTPGLSVAITARDKTLRTITLGYANVDAKTPVTPQTRFAVGSITKSMTSLALMQLHDAGRLALDAPVKRYLPWFSIDSAGRPVLVHELLSHTAGIPDDYSSSPQFWYDSYALRYTKTLFRPGTSWSYSNDGYATLGALLATLDRRAWSTSLQTRVFDQLGMTDSSPYFTPETLATAALGYQFRDNDRPAPLHPVLVASAPFDFVDAAGSVLSTPEDMARYMRFYLNGGKTESGRQLISPATFASMTSPDHYLDGKPAGAAEVELAEAPDFYRQYGYGLAIFQHGGDKLIGHTGGISGYTACMQMNLTRGFGVIAMANLVEAPLHPCAIVLYAMQVLAAQSAGKPLPAPPADPDPALVKNATAYAGTYHGPDGKPVIIAAQEQHLFLNEGTASIPLYPRGDDAFFADDPRFATYLIVFHRNRAKAVTEMTYGDRWYPNDRYSGPRTFTHPAAWNALVGRYENEYEGSVSTTRVLIVKNHLTFDGASPLVPNKDGTFQSGDSVVRFDSYAGGVAQRVTIDDTVLYRVELP
jgi:CubicO group peptidase (beta-lactamase class C family)